MTATTDFSDRDGVIWSDGKYIPWRDAKVHVLTHTFHYGLGVFEGVRAYKTDKGTAIFRLHDHTDRLFNSAHILKMKMPYSKDELNQVQLEVIKRNQLEVAYLRPLVYYGAESIGIHAANLTAHVMVATWEWGTYLGKGALNNGVRAAISSFTRGHVNSIMCRAKTCGNYVNSVLAMQEAIGNGYDEAILLDQQGYLAEGSGANLFAVKKGVLHTPPLTSVLCGITRETIIQLASDFNIPVRETRMTRDDLYCADEAFFTGSAAEVTPICEVDRRTIGSGKPGAITQQLQSAYFDVVEGRNDKYQDWLTYV